MKKIEISDFLDFKFLSQPAFSPDGKSTAFIVQTADIKLNGYKGNLYLLKDDNSIVKMTSSDDVNSFSWDKCGNLIFSSEREKINANDLKNSIKNTDYYSISIDGCESKKIFSIPLSCKKLLDIGNGKFIIEALSDIDYPDVSGMKKSQTDNVLKKHIEPPYESLTEVPFWKNNEGFTNHIRKSLFIYNSYNENLEAVTDPFFDVSSWDYRNNKIITVGSIFTDVHLVNAGVYLYDIPSKITEEIFKPGKYRCDHAKFLNDDTIIINAAINKEYGISSHCDFYSYNIYTRDMKLLCKFDRFAGQAKICSDCFLGGGNNVKTDNEKFYFTTTINDISCLYCIDKNGNIEDIYSKNGTSVKTFDVQNGKIVINAMQGKGIAELYDGNGLRLTHFNDKYFEEHYLSIPEKHEFTASDGYSITGWAMKPIGFDENKKYPTILHIHGGPKTAFGEIYFHEMQVWASNGYFVIFCNPRGSDGKGSEFSYISDDYSNIPYNNIMEFTDEMIKKYPQIDNTRMGVTGGSYGGYMTNWIIGHTDRFKAAVSQRSISNWISFEGTSDIGYYLPKMQVMGTTAESPEILWDASPLKYADKAVTPTLFIHSDEDYRCWKVEAISMFTALKMHNVPSKLCLFKGENHELSRSGKPRNRIKRMVEILNWMDMYLKGGND